MDNFKLSNETDPRELEYWQKVFPEKTNEDHLKHIFKFNSYLSEVRQNKLKHIHLATEQYMEDNKNNPKKLEYWRSIFPNKTDAQLEEYRTRWGKENPMYNKFKREE